MLAPTVSIFPVFPSNIYVCACSVCSIKKDIECTFGILKKRFRILRLPFNLSKKEDIGLVFKACAVLHNWLLEVDGLAAIGREEEHYLSTEVHSLTATRFSTKLSNVVASPDSDFMFLGAAQNMTTVPSDKEQQAFNAQRKILVEHFIYKLANGGIHRRMTASMALGTTNTE